MLGSVLLVFRISSRLMPLSSFVKLLWKLNWFETLPAGHRNYKAEDIFVKEGPKFPLIYSLISSPAWKTSKASRVQLVLYSHNKHVYLRWHNTSIRGASVGRGQHISMDCFTNTWSSNNYSSHCHYFPKDSLIQLLQRSRIIQDSWQLHFILANHI